ncbi:MAG: methyl-accepting chemotaxis protein [Beijerinckiaceae bacterium]
MLSTKRRIQLIGIIAVIGASFAALVQYVGIQKIQALEEQILGITTFRMINLQLDGKVIETRLLEKDFIHLKRQQLVEAHAKSMESTVQRLNALRDKSKEIANGADFKDELDQLAGRLVSYNMAFAQVVRTATYLGLDEDKGLEGVFRKSVHDLEAELKHLGESDLLNHMLQMRRHEKDFIVRGAQINVDNFGTSHKALLKHLDRISMPQKMRTDLEAKTNDYNAKFQDYVESRLRYQFEISELAEYANSVDVVIEAILKKLNALYDKNYAEIQENSKLIQATILATVLVILAIMMIATFLVSRSVVNPLERLHIAMKSLASGDLKTSIPDINRKDEIGSMAKATDQFRSSLLETETLRAERDQMAAAEQFERQKLMTDVAADFESKVGEIIVGVSTSAEQLNMSVSGLSSMMEETSAQAQTVAEASEEASNSTAAVATATQQVSASIESVAQSVERSSIITDKAAADADQLAQGMRELNETMINVNAIIDLISSVAAQTNLLALNATIESARAGEHGRGFAVVASEVKNLAAKTTQSTADITQRITQMRQVLNTAMSAAGNIDGSVREMRHLSSSIAAAMTEQSAAARSIADNTGKASLSAETARNGVVQMADAAVETSASSQQLAQTSTSLQMEASRLRDEVNSFLATLRAA